MRHPAVRRSNLKRNNLILLKKGLETLSHCIEKHEGYGSIIIYALTTAYADAVYNFLETIYPGQVARYHAKIQPKKLKRQMELDFLQEKTKIMVAT